MKRVLGWIVGCMLLASSLEAWAACRTLQLRDSVEVGPGELSLADLLPPGSCPRLYQAAARVSLGAVPRAGSERVLDGQEIGQRLARLQDGADSMPGIGSPPASVPARIIVRLAGRMASCGDLAHFLVAAVRDVASDPGWQNHLHCSGAGNVPAGAALELMKTAWNPLLRHWEFTLRCERAEECVPFLLWADAKPDREGFSARALRDQPGDPVVKRGETATLTWDQGGIRVVLPVMCLEAGGIGQSIRVRLENAGRTLRAQVVGAGALRAIL